MINAFRSQRVQRPVRVFLSYPRVRKDVLRELRGAATPLVQSGAAILWYDEGHLLPGDVWQARIDEELARADVVVALVCAELLGG